MFMIKGDHHMIIIRIIHIYTQSLSNSLQDGLDEFDIVKRITKYWMSQSLYFHERFQPEMLTWWLTSL